MRAVEKWLQSDDADKFAEAAIRCHHLGGFCISDGYCHRDGACFRSDAYAKKQAYDAICRAAENEPSDVARFINMAAAMLKATDV